MDAQQQRLEVEAAGADDDDLAVEDTPLGQCPGERGGQLGEIPVHRFFVTALQQDLVAVAEHQGSEAVPLRLELPATVVGQPIGGCRQHGRERRIEWQVHGLILVNLYHAPVRRARQARGASLKVARCDVAARCNASRLV